MTAVILAFPIVSMAGSGLEQAAWASAGLVDDRDRRGPPDARRDPAAERSANLGTIRMTNTADATGVGSEADVGNSTGQIASASRRARSRRVDAMPDETGAGYRPSDSESGASGNPCIAAADRAPRRTGVPQSVMRAVTLAETGRGGPGGFAP